MTALETPEIGGYFQLECMRGEELYPYAHHLNLGRSALVTLMQSLRLDRIWLPRLLCASVFEACQDAGFAIETYKVGYDLLPQGPLPSDQKAAFYLVNYYGQIRDEQIRDLSAHTSNLILDNTHALFQAPLPHTPTIYSIRKFLGVPDGAYLAFDGAISLEETDRSGDRMRHILGRFEGTASAYYHDMLDTADSFRHMGPREMSPLTRNLLHGIDYAAVQARRDANFALLASELSGINRLAIHAPSGAFCYPLLVSDGDTYRRKLAEQHIYVPTYWKNVIDGEPEGSVEHDLAANVLALPCDHRYGAADMERVASAVRKIAQEARQ